MHSGGNRIYRLHLIHNRLFAEWIEYGVLDNFSGFCGPKTRLVNWSSRTTLTFCICLCVCLLWYVVIFSAVSESVNYKVTWLCLFESMASYELQISPWWSSLSEVSHSLCIFLEQLALKYMHVKLLFAISV